MEKNSWFVLLSPMEVKSILEDLPLKIQVETLLEFVERSTLCFGCSFSGDSGILCLPLLPHKVGMLKSLNDPEISQQNQVFCNKRDLTKEEIHLQLQEEKKMRQKQLQEQKKSHDAESANDDHKDDEGESLVMMMMMMMMMKRKMMRKAVMMMKRKVMKRKRKIILAVWSGE